MARICPLISAGTSSDKWTYCNEACVFCADDGECMIRTKLAYEIATLRKTAMRTQDAPLPDSDLKEPEHSAL